jgi:hypothetical protein
MGSPNKIPEGLYYIAKDNTLNELLMPADSQVNVTAPPDLLADLCTTDSSVWKLKLTPKDGGRYDFFSITSEDATALSYDDNTMNVVLEDVDATDDRQLWRFQNILSTTVGGT